MLFQNYIKRILKALVIAFVMLAAPAFACDSNEFEYNGNCIESKFEITTTNINDDDYFAFSMSAAGVFYVDWGDGNVEQIDRTNDTTVALYSHTYDTNNDPNDNTGSAQSYTIKFGGLATGYNNVYNGSSSSLVSNIGYAIRFGCGTADTVVYTSVNESRSVTCASARTKLAGISGSLGALFPTIGGAAATAGLGITDAALLAIQPRFAGIFFNCTNMVGQIPANLFDGVSGTIAKWMFNDLFGGCSNLGRSTINGNRQYYIPATLFAGIDTSTIYTTSVSSGIFYNAGFLTSCPTGTNQAMTGFESFFGNGQIACIENNEIYCKYGQKYDSTTMSCVACDANDTCDTGFTQQCPNGYMGNATSTQCETQYTITYNLDGGTNNANNPATYGTGSATITLKDPNKANYKFMGWYEYSDFSGSEVTQIATGSTGNKTLYAKWEAFTNKFQVTTTQIPDDDYYGFFISAAGMFWVDWGDGTIERFDRTNNTNPTYYSHTYDTNNNPNDSTGSAQSYDVKFDGMATGYNNEYYWLFWPAVAFGSAPNGSGYTYEYSNNNGLVVDPTVIRARVYSISGSLGAIFPTKSDSVTMLSMTDNELRGVQPSFNGAFVGCNNLVGDIPAGLFSGVNGRPAPLMFYSTFSGCSGLTGSIPAGLFSGISGAPAQSMFSYTFYNCSNLTGSIPAGLFSGISGAPAPLMFGSTFSGCSGLTGSIPAGLFSGISGAPAVMMFDSTFSGCTNLGRATVNGDSQYYIPATLFAGIDTDTTADNQMRYVFGAGLANHTSMLTRCPSGTNKAMTGFESYFDGKDACVPNTSVYCKKGERFDTTTHGCAVCQSGDVCPDAGAEYDCLQYGTVGNAVAANGFDGNSTSTQCLQVYNITYELNGGTNNANNPSSYTIESSEIYLRYPTKSDYTFGGWYDNAQFTGDQIDWIHSGSTGNKQLYAKWRPTAYDIIYNNMSGATNNANNPATYTVESSTITLQNPTKNGYTFDGWYDNSSFTGDAITEIAAGSTGVKSLYAKWTPTTYNITYNNMSDATNNANNPSIYTVESSRIILQDPTKIGYIFHGWYADSNFENYNYVIGAGSTGDKEFYAKWELCPAGYYCSSSSLKQVCGDGMWSDEGTTSAEGCYKCKAGYYCYETNNSMYKAECLLEGYYCPEGSSSRQVCPEGAYCLAGSTEPTACPAGTYNNFTGGKSVDDCEQCPEGYYCPEGSSSRTSCPSGQWSDAGSESAEDCYACPPGYYCYNWSYDDSIINSKLQCSAGYYCPEGSSSQKSCLPGYYCPAGSSKMTSCPAGTYYRYYGGTSADSCSEQCTAGYYCDGTNGRQGCPAGSYCPTGSTEPTACTGNTYSNSGASSCSSCSTGYEANQDHTQCTVITYNITYELDGGTDNYNPSVYTVKSSFNLTEPTKTGYLFLGWYDNNSFSGYAVTSLANGRTGNITLYAKWAQVYDITYDTTGANYVPETNPVQYYVNNNGSYTYYYYDGKDWQWYTNYSIPLAAPSGDQEFRGWYICPSSQHYNDDKNNCVFYNYSGSDSYVNPPANDTGDLMIYAVFGPQTIQCSAGEYAWYDGSNLWCSGYCPNDHYCDGKNSQGGYDLTAEDNGKHSCASYDSNRPYSDSDSTSPDECGVCPRFDWKSVDYPVMEDDNFMMDTFSEYGIWKNLNGNGVESVNGCVVPVAGFNFEVEKCLMQQEMTAEELQEEYGDDYYTMGFDQPCNWGNAEVGLMTCRYDTQTKNYTGCSSMVSNCTGDNGADTIALVSEFMNAMESESADDLLNLELRRKGLNQSTVNWNTFFKQNNSYINDLNTLNGVEEITKSAQGCDTQTCSAGEYARIEYVNGVATGSCEPCPAGSYCPDSKTYSFANGDFTVDPNNSNVYTAGKYACPAGATSVAESTTCTCVSGSGYNPVGNSVVNVSVGNVSTTKTPELITLTDDNGNEYPACANVYVAALNTTAFNSWVSGGMSSDDLLTRAGARVVVCKYNATDSKYDLCTPAFTACNGQFAQLMLAPVGTIVSNLAQMFAEDENASSLPDEGFESIPDTLGLDALQTINACPDPDMPQQIAGSCASGYYWENYYSDNKDRTVYTGNNCCPDGYACCLAGTKYDATIGRCDECSGLSCPVSYTERVVCPEGSYIDQTAIGTENQCVTCPIGHYCPGVAWDNTTTFDSGKYECADGSYADTTGLSVCSLCPGGASTGGATGSTSDSACSTTTCVDGAAHDPLGTTFVSGATKQSALVTMYDTDKKDTYQTCAKAYISVLDNTVFANGIANSTTDELSKSGMRLVMCLFNDTTNKYTDCSYAVPACDANYRDMMLNYTTEQIAGALASNFSAPGIPDNISRANASGALGIDGVRNFWGSAEDGTPTCAASCPVGYYWENYENDKENETIYTGNTCCPDGYVCCLAGYKYDFEDGRCAKCSGSSCPTSYTKSVVCEPGTYINQAEIGTANQCLPCTAGSYCPGIVWDPATTFDSGKYTCDANYYSNASATSCSACPAGATSSAGASACTCADGNLPAYRPAGTFLTNTDINGAVKDSEPATYMDGNEQEYQACTTVYTSALNKTALDEWIAGDNADDSKLAEAGLRIAICKYNTTDNKYNLCSPAFTACSNEYAQMFIPASTSQIMMMLAEGEPLPDDWLTTVSNTSGIDALQTENTCPDMDIDCATGYYWENEYDDKYDEYKYTGNNCCPDGYACCLADTKYDTETNSCQPCSGSSCPTTYTQTLKPVVCPDANQSYTNIPQDGSAGVLELGAYQKSYGTTENECLTLRLYYENGEPLMASEFESMDINDWIDAGASVAFCKYNSQTGNYDGNCSKKYSMCADQNMADLMNTLTTDGSVAVVSSMFNIDTPEEFDALLTENAADLASETAVDRCNTCQSGHVCCAEGTYINPDTTTHGTENQCLACPVGYYCPGDDWDTSTTLSTNKTACGAGTYNDLENQTSVSACNTCPVENSTGSNAGASECRCSLGHHWDSSAHTCAANIVNINWDGIINPGDAGTCTYGGTYTAPSAPETVPTGYMFIGWRIVSSVSNDNNNLEEQNNES